MEGYKEFLASKRVVFKSTGIEVNPDDIHPLLFPFQRDVTAWAVRKGRCAVFLDTGLGKTLVQLEWARMLSKKTLIIAPLSVARQTVREGRKIDLSVHYVRSQEEVDSLAATGEKLFITNYEMTDKFDASTFGAVVLDESSILKAISGKTRRKLTKMFADTPFKLCCTATPAPNDYVELGNHAEFLGICSRSEMLAQFFINANKEHTFYNNGKAYRKKGSNKAGQEWRLKHHAEQPFFRWLSSWAIVMTKPSDLGYDDDGFILPPLKIHTHFVEADYRPDDQLFFTHIKGIRELAEIRRQTLPQRLERLIELINGNNDQWIVWVGLNEESKVAAEALSGAIEVCGDDSPDDKAKAFEDFQDGKYRVLVTKGKIGGFGMNFQNAHKMAFFGLSHSWESYYQCIRREWRYLQTEPVDVHIVLSDIEDAIYHNVMRKDAQSRRLREEMVKQLERFEKEELGMVAPLEESYTEDTIVTENWTAMLGDSSERLSEIADCSVDLSVYSPPFADLYTYTASPRDLGNSHNWDEFFAHYAFIIREVLRVTKPGRVTCVHTSDIPALAQSDGYIGIKDFPGRVIAAYEDEGWIFHGRIVISKNPQALRDGTPILTPSGWMPIEQLAVGDAVIGKNGQSTVITDIPYKGLQEIIRVTFDDGAWVDCGPQHLWTLRTSINNPWQTITAQELLKQGAVTPSGYLRYQIPVMAGAEFVSESPLPIPPRLLGALLSDGNWANQRGVSITKDKELVESLPLPEGHSLALRPNSGRAEGRTATYGIVGPEWHRNDVLAGLRDLGLKSCRAWEKFIPHSYLFASIEDRRELLRGLLDGDGRIHPTGGILFRTTSERMAYEVAHLVQSLGGLARVKEKDGNFYSNGKRGRPIWNITVRLNGEWCPFTLERKAQHWTENRRTPRRNVASVKHTGETAPCTCISVEAQDGLFVTKDFIVTHNSQAIRTHSKGLLFVQLKKDSVHSRPALLDQVLVFRKPGENEVPITPVDNGEMDNELWIKWACGIWHDINETNVLQHGYGHGRAHDDEKHVCPLQLETIERCIKLYSNPGETVLSPFAGIGSEIYQAVKFGRKGIGIELKPSYFEMMVKNVKEAQQQASQVDLFTMAGIQVEAKREQHPQYSGAMA